MARFLERMKNGKGYQPPRATGIFSDVSRDSPNAPFIEQLYRDGITRGTTATTFSPNDTVPREQMAAFIVRLLRGPDFHRDGESRFVDVKNPDFVGYIEELADMGITRGCTPNEFCPGDMVPRDQMAAFLMRALHPGPDPEARGTIGDLEPGNSLNGRVEQAVEEGIMEACTGTILIDPCTNAGSRYFDETGKTVSGDVLDYWDRSGGLQGAGYPTSEPFPSVGADGVTHRTQCFERRVLEEHLENTCDYRILGRQLGRLRFEKMYPHGAVAQWLPKESDIGARFEETGKAMSRKMLAHWEKTGGLRENGYPITNELWEGGRLVQYFERSLFEYHPENPGSEYEIQGALLGNDAPECGGGGAPVALGHPGPIPPKPSDTIDRPAFLYLGSNEVGLAQVVHDHDDQNLLDCSTDYTINYVVETGAVTSSSVFVKSVQVHYHPPAGTVIWPWALDVWSTERDSYMFGDEVGVPKTEGNWHTFRIDKNFPVRPNQGAVIEFATAGNSGSLPLTIDTSGTQCGRKGIIVVIPK